MLFRIARAFEGRARLGSRRGLALMAGIVVAACIALLLLYMGTPVPAPTGPRDGPLPDRSERQAQAPDGATAAESGQDAAEWIKLARGHVRQGRFSEAVMAYANAAILRPNDAQLLADYADALAVANGRRLQGEPEQLIQRALSVDPRNVKALALAGNGAFEKKHYGEAVGHWQRLLELVNPDSDVARSARAGIREAQTRLAAVSGIQATDNSRDVTPGSRAAPAHGVPGPATGQPVSVTGTIGVSPALAGKVAPGDTLFILARPLEAAHMPLAIVSRQAGALPTSFSFKDALSMPSGQPTPQKFVVVALVSRSGRAIPRSGDLQGLSSPVKNGDRGVIITIDQVVP